MKESTIRLAIITFDWPESRISSYIGRRQVATFKATARELNKMEVEAIRTLDPFHDPAIEEDVVTA